MSLVDRGLDPVAGLGRTRQGTVYRGAIQGERALIFVTVGTQLSFDRLVGEVDLWAGRSGTEVIAQVGPSERTFSNINTVPFLKPDETQSLFKQSECIVSHAGMGTVLSSLAIQKPLVVMPRDASLREHRNDHQFATARCLAKRSLANVAWDVNELAEHLDRLFELKASRAISSHAYDNLLDAVHNFLTL